MARRMIRKVLVLSLIPGFGVARSDLIVTLSPMGPDGQTFVQGPSGSVAVPPTGTIDVEVRLSVDGADDPLDGATFIQFDFNSTGDSITVS
ncbi:MAG: hypothetical protein ACE5EX_08055, partial [Phycisphaerae bacterium]